jgi:hypothetical protein
VGVVQGSFRRWAHGCRHAGGVEVERDEDRGIWSDVRQVQLLLEPLVASAFFGDTPNLRRLVWGNVSGTITRRASRKLR